MINVIRFKKSILMISGLLMVSLSLTACEPLRKKFVRQKKKNQVEDQNFIPVLEPQEYLAPEFNPVENYKQHYALVKVWYKDLESTVDGKTNNKQVHYLINQIREHIVEMQKLVDATGVADLDKLGTFLNYYEDSLENAWPMRNVARIKSDMRAFHRFLREYLNESKLEGRFVSVVK